MSDATLQAAARAHDWALWDSLMRRAGLALYGSYGPPCAVCSWVLATWPLFKTRSSRPTLQALYSQPTAPAICNVHRHRYWSWAASISAPIVQSDPLP